MMVTSDWLEVGMPLKVVWSSVMVECGVQFAVMLGESKMLELPAVNWDFQEKVTNTPVSD